METPFLFAVVKHNVETPRHGNDQLPQGFVRMPAPLRAPWHVVKVIHALNVERDVLTALDEGQIASGIGDFGQINEITTVYRHNLMGIQVFDSAFTQYSLRPL